MLDFLKISTSSELLERNFGSGSSLNEDIDCVLVFVHSCFSFFSVKIAISILGVDDVISLVFEFFNYFFKIFSFGSIDEDIQFLTSILFSNALQKVGDKVSSVEILEPRGRTLNFSHKVGDIVEDLEGNTIGQKEVRL